MAQSFDCSHRPQSLQSTRRPTQPLIDTDRTLLRRKNDHSRERQEHANELQSAKPFAEHDMGERARHCRIERSQHRHELKLTERHRNRKE